MSCKTPPLFYNAKELDRKTVCAKFAHTAYIRIGDISIFGQESNPTTLRLAKMNLAIRGIDARIELGDRLMEAYQEAEEDKRGGCGKNKDNNADNRLCITYRLFA